MATKTYRVRNFLPLHREVWTKKASGTQKSIKTYQTGEQIDLEEAEFQKYEHLLETEEQFKSREKASGTTKKAG